MTFMKNIIFCFLFALVLTACGGGSGSGNSPDGSYSYSPGSLSFSAQVDAVTPAAQIITLTAQSSQTEVPDVNYTSNVIDSAYLDIVDSDTAEITVTVLSPAVLGVGTHTSSIQIVNSKGTVTIPVTYTVTAIPPGVAEVHFISPYTVAPSVAHDVIIRGSGFSRFSNSNLPTVTIGSLAASNISVVNDSMLTATAPALSAGTHAVEVSGGSVTFTSTASLNVVAAQTYQTTNISSTGEKSKLIFDKKRQALYVVNTTSDTLERYTYQSGTTWDADSLSLSGLSDAALAADGNTLVLVDGSSFYEVDADAATLAAGNAVNAPLDYYDSVDVINWSSSGDMIAVSNNQWSPVFTYNILSGAADKLTYFNSSHIEVGYSIYQPWLFDVADGGQLYFGEHGSTGSELYVLNSSDNTITATGLTTGLSGFTSLALTPDATTILVNGQDIYNADLSTLLGSLPQTHTRGVLSPDGNTAYVFIDFNGSQYNILKAYDITTPSSPVQIGSDLLLANGPGLRARMVISDDGNTLFMAGTDNVNIIDLATLSF